MERILLEGTPRGYPAPPNLPAFCNGSTEFGITRLHRLDLRPAAQHQRKQVQCLPEGDTPRNRGDLLLARQKRAADRVEPGEQRQAQLGHMIASLRASEKAFA